MAKTVRKPLQFEIPEDVHIYQCSRCGKYKENAQGLFYMSSNSPLYKYHNGYTTICTDCVNGLFREMEREYGRKIAFITTCHYLDLYYDENAYNEMNDAAKNVDSFSFGRYLQRVNTKKYDGKTFGTYLMELAGGENKPNEDNGESERGWKSEDIKNKNYVLSTVGYDCFTDSNYSATDLRYLFNVLADYLTDSIVEDPHKIQCVISLVKTMLQQDKIDRLISAEFNKRTPDSKTLDTLGTLKKNVNAVIMTIASDNGISVKGSGKNQSGNNTLTGIMKAMVDADYEPIKANYIDAKTSESYLEVERISAKALNDELNFQSDDYASMVAEQADMIREKDAKIEKLEEELRLLKIENKGGV